MLDVIPHVSKVYMNDNTKAKEEEFDEPLDWEGDDVYVDVFEPIETQESTQPQIREDRKSKVTVQYAQIKSINPVYHYLLLTFVVL